METERIRNKYIKQIKTQKKSSQNSPSKKEKESLKNNINISNNKTKEKNISNSPSQKSIKDNKSIIKKNYLHSLLKSSSTSNVRETIKTTFQKTKDEEKKIENLKKNPFQNSFINVRSSINNNNKLKNSNTINSKGLNNKKKTRKIMNNSFDNILEKEKVEKPAKTKKDLNAHPFLSRLSLNNMEIVQEKIENEEIEEIISTTTSNSNTPLKDNKENLFERFLNNENGIIKKRIFDKKKIIKKPIANPTKIITRIYTEANPVKARFFNSFDYGSNFFINNQNKKNLSIENKNDYVNTQDLFIFEGKFKLIEKYIKENKIRLINKTSFEWFNYYFNCSLKGNLTQFFNDIKIKRIIEDSNTLSLISMLLIYDLSFKNDYFAFSLNAIKNLFQLSFKNYMLIWENFLTNIQSHLINDNWVIKINSISLKDISDKENIINEIDKNVDQIYENITLILISYKDNTKKINSHLIEMFNHYSKYTHNNIYQISISKILRVKNLNSSITYSEEKNKKPEINYFIKSSPMKPLTLVLDLDETLVSFIFTNENEGISRIRPYLFQFLNLVKNYYEIIIFTAGTKEYADPVLDIIEENKGKYFSYRLYRESCTVIDNQYTKDISNLGRDLSKTIIVDNLSQNFILQKDNGILISSFWGEDIHDKCLLYLGRILVSIGIEMMENNYLLDIRDELIKYKDDILNKVSIK